MCSGPSSMSSFDRDHQNANLKIKCMIDIDDIWIERILSIPDLRKRIMFTDTAGHFGAGDIRGYNTGKYPVFDSRETADALFLHHPILKMLVSPSQFVSVFMASHDFTCFVPSDIVALCLCYVDYGHLLPRLIPWAHLGTSWCRRNNKDFQRMIDHGKKMSTYCLFRNMSLQGDPHWNKFKNHWSPWRFYVSVNVGEVGTEPSGSILNESIIPLFRIEKKGDSYWRYTGPSWNPWIRNGPSPAVRCNDIEHRGNVYVKRSERIRLIEIDHERFQQAQYQYVQRRPRQSFSKSKYIAPFGWSKKYGEKKEKRSAKKVVVDSYLPQSVLDDIDQCSH